MIHFFLKKIDVGRIFTQRLAFLLYAAYLSKGYELIDDGINDNAGRAHWNSAGNIV